MTRGHSRVSGDLHLSKASGGGSQIGRLRSCGEKIITVIMLLIRVAANAHEGQQDNDDDR